MVSLPFGNRTSPAWKPWKRKQYKFKMWMDSSEQTIAKFTTPSIAQFSPLHIDFTSDDSNDNDSQHSDANKQIH